MHNRAIGQAFKDLIDEAFRHYRIWQNDRDRHGDDEWTISFKEKVALNLKQWWDKAGYEAQKLLLPPSTKSGAMVVFSPSSRNSS